MILSEGRNSVIYREGDRVVKVPKNGGSLANLNEVAIGRAIDHPAILPLLDIRPVKTTRVATVLPYIECKRYPDNVNRAIRDLAGAVLFLHLAGILHLDIKTSNVLVDTRTDRCFLTDFGHAVWSSKLRVEKTGTHGTVYCQPPEACTSFVYTDRSDVWCLGWTYAEFLLKRTISDPQSLPRWNLPAQYTQLLCHMLCRVEDRWSMQQVCQYLRIDEVPGRLTAPPGAYQGSSPITAQVHYIEAHGIKRNVAIWLVAKVLFDANVKLSGTVRERQAAVLYLNGYLVNPLWLCSALDPAPPNE